MLAAIQQLLPETDLWFINVEQTDTKFKALMNAPNAEEVTGQFEFLLRL